MKACFSIEDIHDLVFPTNDSFLKFFVGIKLCFRTWSFISASSGDSTRTIQEFLLEEGLTYLRCSYTNGRQMKHIDFPLPAGRLANRRRLLDRTRTRSLLSLGLRMVGQNQAFGIRRGFTETVEKLIRSLRTTRRSVPQTASTSMFPVRSGEGLVKVKLVHNYACGARFAI